MDQAIKAEWVAALRSGDYEQGTGVLHYADQFCCLGVLCDIAVKHGVLTATRQEVDGEVHYDGSDIYLPPSVTRWAGLDEYDPEVIYANTERRLSHINDRHHSFGTIADLIESQL